jgi:hypothetical protein
MTTEKKTRTPKPLIEHRDILGRLLKIGDVVAVSLHNNMKIARVTKLNPKMVKVQLLNVKTSTWYTGSHNKYPEDLVIVDGPYVTMYILKTSA